MEYNSNSGKPRDLLLHHIKKAGLVGNDWTDSQTDLFSEEELSNLMNKMLHAFIKQSSCGLLSKYAIIYYCQLIPQKQDVAYQCCKLWRSINAYKDIRMESQMFYNFFNQIYGQEVLDFYFKLRRALVKYVYGDTAEITHPLTNVYLSADKLIMTTEKMLTVLYSGIINNGNNNKGMKSFSEKLANLMKGLLKNTEVDHLQRIKIIDFLCYCVMEYKAIGLVKIDYSELSTNNNINSQTSKITLKGSSSIFGMPESKIPLDSQEMTQNLTKQMQKHRERGYFDSKGGTPIKIKGGNIPYENNPPPKREYANLQKTGNSTVLKKTPRNQLKNNTDIQDMKKHFRSKTPVNNAPRNNILPIETSEQMLNFQKKVQTLEKQITELLELRENDNKRILELESENNSLKMQKEEYSKICDQLQQENLELHTKINKKSSLLNKSPEEKVLILKSPQNYNETHNFAKNGSSNKADNRSMTQLIQAAGSAKNIKDQKIQYVKPQLTLDEAISRTKIQVEEEKNEESPPPLPPRNDDSDENSLDDIQDL